MPLARIDLAEGRSANYRKTIGEVVYDAQVEVLKAPKNDRFQVVTEHPAQDFIFDPSGPHAQALVAISGLDNLPVRCTSLTT
jgi:hypothetical protein